MHINFLLNSNCLIDPIIIGRNVIKSVNSYTLMLITLSGPCIAGGSCPRQENFFFSNIVFDFIGLFLVDILVRNLSLPPQTKNPRYGPDY